MIVFADLCDSDGDDLPTWRTSAHRCHRHTCLPLQKTNQGEADDLDDSDDRDDDVNDDDGHIDG